MLLHYHWISLCQSFCVQFLFECLSFTRVNVQCDVHSLIMSPFSVHVSWRGQGNRHPKTARPCEALGITPGHPTMQWSGCDHCCHLSGWACCSPAETTSRPCVSVLDLAPEGPEEFVQQRLLEHGTQNSDVSTPDVEVPSRSVWWRWELEGQLLCGA